MNPAADFTWVDGERRIRFGRTALDDATALLPERGFDGYALLTTPRAAEQAPAVVEGATAVLDVPSGGVPDAAAKVREQVAGRPIVALGGGRVIDAAKALGGADGLPVAAIPTTLSGAPFTRVHRMPAGVDEPAMVRPALVIADAALMASQPMPDLAGSAMNSLAHATESLYVPLANPVATMAALRAASLFASGLADPREPRPDHLALAALLGSWAVGTTGFAIHHVVCQTLVGALGLPHARTNAVMLPHTVRFMAMRAPDAIEALRKAIGGDVADLAATSGATTLGELGVEEPQIDAVVEAASRRPDLANTPGGAPTPERLRAFVQAAL